MEKFWFCENYKKQIDDNNKLLEHLRLSVHNEGLSNLQIAHKKLKKNIDDSKEKLRLPYISIKNEKDMLIKLKSIAMKSLKKYPTTYEHDQDILTNKEKLTSNQKNCVIFRMGEKKVNL